MDDARVVRLGERREHLPEHRDAVLGTHRSVAADEALEALAAEVLHDDVRRAVGLVTEVEDGDGIRVIEAARSLRLAKEPLQRARVRAHVGVEHLDGDDLVDGPLRSSVHPAHGPGSEEPIDDVLPRDRSA